MPFFFKINVFNVIIEAKYIKKKIHNHKVSHTKITLLQLISVQYPSAHTIVNTIQTI